MLLPEDIEICSSQPKIFNESLIDPKYLLKVEPTSFSCHNIYAFQATLYFP